MTSRVAGVDACRLSKGKTGWVAVVLDEGKAEDVVFVESFRKLCDQLQECGVIAVDIPIGFPDWDNNGIRRCDEEARSFVKGRASSVFMTPPREVLEKGSHKAASALYRRHTGKGISIQTYSLRSKILEVNDVLIADPKLRRKVREVHPEVSFSEMAIVFDDDVLDGKKTWVGQEQRRKALTEERPAIKFNPLRFKGDVRRIPADDLYDAAAAAWTAMRIASKQAWKFPENPGSDEPTIWC